jgi:predicted DNA-binding transcriptional regulator YafY
MRDEKISLLIELALDMQVRTRGISLQDIEEKMNVVHRSAQRNIKILESVFPQIERFTGTNGEARWRMPQNVAVPIRGLSADDLQLLEDARALFVANKRDGQARKIRRLSSKLKNMLKKEEIAKLEPDLETLNKANAVAVRPGPRSLISNEILDPIQEAIMGYQKIYIEYRNSDDDGVSELELEPYGILYGHRNYLVAKNPNRDDGKLRHYSLPKITSVKLCDNGFVKDDEFVLGEYARQSFGVYNEAPKSVVWRFTGKAVEKAQDFEFHPNQTMKLLLDGSLQVEFEAGGFQEMAWHLMAWGRDVEVISPQELIDIMPEHVPHWKVSP